MITQPKPTDKDYTKHNPGSAGRKDYKLEWVRFPSYSVECVEFEYHTGCAFNSEMHTASINGESKYRISYLYDRVNKRETAKLECVSPYVDLLTLTDTTMKERENFIRFLKVIADDCHFGFTSDEARDSVMLGMTKEAQEKERKEFEKIMKTQLQKKTLKGAK